MRSWDLETLVGSPEWQNLAGGEKTRRALLKGLMAAGAFVAASRLPLSARAQDAEYIGTGPLEGELAAEQVIRLSTQEPSSMDPGVSTGDWELDILFNIFDGLVGVDMKTGDVVGRAAESWTFNDDASEFTFTLKPGMVWSDGTPLTANDFVYAWRRVLDPETLSEYVAALAPIKNGEAIAAGEAALEDLGVVATDDVTLVVTLEGPTPFFPLLASTWTFYPVPQHVVDEHAEAWVEAENIVSNGPFIMTGWTHDQEIVLEPNPNYAGEAPTLTRAEYKILADNAAQSYIAYEAGELDYCAPQGSDLDRVLADAEKAKDIISFSTSNCIFIVCDCTNAPTDKAEVRQALGKAIDRATLTGTILNGQYNPAYTLLPADIPGNNPDAAIVESVDEAKALMAAAGVDPASVSIELTHINDEWRTTVAEYLQATWQEALGITVTLAPIESSTYVDWRASRETNPFNVYLGSWGSDFADASNWFNQNFTTAYNHYRGHWSHREFDELVNTAKFNTNLEERVAQYQQAEAMFMEQMPVIPVLRTKAKRIVRSTVKDLYFQPILSVVHLRTVKIAAE